MKRNNVIVLISDEVEVFGNFKKLCLTKKFPYHSLKVLKFPIKYNEYVIHKVKFN